MHVGAVPRFAPQLQAAVSPTSIIDRTRQTTSASACPKRLAACHAGAQSVRPILPSSPRILALRGRDATACTSTNRPVASYSASVRIIRPHASLRSHCSPLASSDPTPAGSDGVGPVSTANDGSTAFAGAGAGCSCVATPVAGMGTADLSSSVTQDGSCSLRKRVYCT